MKAIHVGHIIQSGIAAMIFVSLYRRTPASAGFAAAFTLSLFLLLGIGWYGGRLRAAIRSSRIL